ncbi:MAG: AbiJ-NTD4 domain-containing protein [Alphaproteobacteria bacterium]
MTLPFFERRREERGELPTTFTYDELPRKVRNQVIMLWQEAGINGLEEIIKYIRKHIGESVLHEDYKNVKMHYYLGELEQFFLETSNVDYALTVVEEIGKAINNEANKHVYDTQAGRKKSKCKNLFSQLNFFLKREGIGWQHNGEMLVKIEDEVFYEEATQKTLGVLRNFNSAYTDYLNAYKNLKEGDFENAITNACKAMESVIKTRFNQNNITYNETDNLSKLLPLIKDNLNIPPFMEDYLNQITGIIQGLGTARNKSGAHGKTEGINKPDEVFTKFVINQAACNILFLAEVEFKK